MRGCTDVQRRRPADTSYRMTGRTDDGNRLVQDDQFDYTYDDNGNLASKTDRVTLDATSYSYDAQDQLIRIDFPDATFATYAYDALGRRIAKDVDDGGGGREVTAYVYDGPDILMEFDGTVSD